MHADQTAQDAHDTETAGVITRPVFLFLAALLIAPVANHLLPLPIEVPGAGLSHKIVAGVLILVGLAFAATGIRNFRRAETPVPTNRPAHTLVTAGIHAWTRNPIYLGMLLLYVGIGVAVRSPWLLALTLPIAIIIRYGVIAREEAYLERRFGDAYREYRGRVRRWL